jgi:hypothetical protein
MALESLEHTHSDSWPTTMDWLDLRNHLVTGHGEPPESVDDLEAYPDGTVGRRKHAEERHRALHIAGANGHGGPLRA